MKDNNKSSGISFCGLLTIAFIVLKLVGVISWEWVWVLAPIWIPLSVCLVVLLVVKIVVKIIEHTMEGS